MQELCGLNKIVALKKWCTFSNSIKITQKNVLFSYLIKLYEYWGNFQSSYETKKSSMEKIMKLMLEKVIMSDRLMSDRHMSDRQMSDEHIHFCNFFSTLKKLA